MHLRLSITQTPYFSFLRHFTPPSEEEDDSSPPPASLRGEIDFAPLLAEFRAKLLSHLEATEQRRLESLQKEGGMVVVDATAGAAFPSPEEEEGNGDE